MPKSKAAELPGVVGVGVSPLKIGDIEKAINKYEKKKEARCSASPDEIAAKNELKAALHLHRDELPKNKDGVPFYRYEEVDYVLEEKLKRRKVGTDDEDDD